MAVLKSNTDPIQANRPQPADLVAGSRWAPNPTSGYDLHDANTGTLVGVTVNGQVALQPVAGASDQNRNVRRPLVLKATRDLDSTDVINWLAPNAADFTIESGDTTITIGADAPTFAAEYGINWLFIGAGLLMPVDSIIWRSLSSFSLQAGAVWSRDSLMTIYKYIPE